MSGSSDSGAKILKGTGGRMRFDQGSDRIVIVDRNNVIIGLMGVRPDGTVGYDFAPEGVDVTTAELAELSASSRFVGFTIADTNTIRVKREAGVNTGIRVVTAPTEAPAFICFASIPGSSPELKHQTPHLVYTETTGVIWGQQSAQYDPSTGTIRFQVHCTDVNPSKGTAETWDFLYFVLYQTIPS
jgi:hypothetical protein